MRWGELPGAEQDQAKGNAHPEKEQKPETFFMGSEVMAPFFRYRDRGFMLAWGSVCYGTVFFVSLPLILGLDEREQPSAPIGEVLLRLLGANMLILVLYEIYGGYIAWWGPRV